MHWLIDELVVAEVRSRTRWTSVVLNIVKLLRRRCQQTRQLLAFAELPIEMVHCFLGFGDGFIGDDGNARRAAAAIILNCEECNRNGSASVSLRWTRCIRMIVP